MIEILDLTCRYGSLLAVNGLSLKVEEGEIFGFIGPNGAGKTTTIKTLATLNLPEAGMVKVAGFDVVTDYRSVREIMGYMPDYIGIYDDLKVWEYLDFFAGAYRIWGARKRRIVDDVLALTDLTSKADAYVESLSRGMKQRLCLAKTLIHDPKVLLLDEPASGLDPRARIEMRELLKELKRMGRTIFLSSHILPELAELCDRVGVVEKGRMVAVGSVEELSRKTRANRVRVEVTSPKDEARRVLSALPEVTEVEELSGILVAGLASPDADLSALLLSLLQGGVKVRSFMPETSDLEEVFLKVTGEDLS